MLMKNNLSSQRGQALIELIIFLPLIVTLYSVISGFANSINGSINQQKIARSYYYYRIQNSSTTPSPLSVPNFESWSYFSVFFIGWRDYVKGEGSPVMPCYKVSIPFKDSPKDKCEDAYNSEKSLWVKVGTVYGTCGATFYHKNGEVYYAPDQGDGDFSAVVDQRSCIIMQ
jgi:hypothetical protein